MKSKVAVRMVLMTVLLFVGFSCEEDPSSSDNGAVVTIEIEQDSLTVYVDSTAQFTAVGRDMDGDEITGQTFIWESANTSIATIDNEGVVTGVAPGNTTVTAKLGEVESLAAEVRVIEGTTTGTVTDIDGNVYQTVKIGDQWWLAENLKVTHYRNGDPIQNVTDTTEWTNLTTGAYCEYGNNSENVDTYGRLYNWFAVNDSRNIAPEGWHVPTDDEWQILVDYCGGGFIAGGKLKSTSGWDNDGNGTDDYGFAALPGGFRSYYDGYFHLMGYYAGFWSATEYLGDLAWIRKLRDSNADISRNFYSKPSGLSLRLLRD